MNLLLVFVVIFSYMAAPSADHVRSEFDLSDRGEVMCESSGTDGRKTRHDSAYWDDQDLTLASDDTVVSCHARPLASLRRPLATEMTLNRLDAMASDLAQKLPVLPDGKTYTLTVVHRDARLAGKIAHILKSRLAEERLPLVEQMPLKSLIEGTLLTLPASCRDHDFSRDPLVHVFIVQLDPEASALRAALCNAEGWTWL